MYKKIINTLIKYFFSILIIFFMNLSSIAQQANKYSSLSGGETTRKDITTNAFSKPAKNLPLKFRQVFTEGNKLFKVDWNSNPNQKFYGLGPTFTQSSCISCHIKDGRSLPPDINKKGIGGLSIFINNYFKDEINYGNKIDTKAITNVKEEGDIIINYEIIKGNFSDGIPYKLFKPNFIIEKYNYGQIKNKIHGRVATQIIGMGLIETIPEKSILEWSDPFDKDEDGISGRPNFIYDPTIKKEVVGRFGWKASKGSIKHQVVSALHEDIGITTIFFPKNRCPEKQVDCKSQLINKSIEASENIVDIISFYTSVIAVPARRGIDNKYIEEGREIFINAGCAKCHIQSVKTGKNSNSQLDFLNNQNIQPFTDLLLHDMGEELAEYSKEGIAYGKEWRTAPLWGLGLIQKVNGKIRLLHDGRARSIQEAILWHGGEAKISRDKFLMMKKSNRELLIKFLESL
ncbi:MAG: thiol oxidoreductase [Rhodospirillaceae bacterium]|nr:thiol oxidoreductase [Rhodospirillaceae bacterium]